MIIILTSSRTNALGSCSASFAATDNALSGASGRASLGDRRISAPSVFNKWIRSVDVRSGTILIIRYLRLFAASAARAIPKLPDDGMTSVSFP